VDELPDFRRFGELKTPSVVCAFCLNQLSTRARLWTVSNNVSAVYERSGEAWLTTTVLARREHWRVNINSFLLNSAR